MTDREGNFYVLYSIRKQKSHVLYSNIGHNMKNFCITVREGNFYVVYSIRKDKRHVSYSNIGQIRTNLCM
jgi:hypothetical protein